MGRKRTSDGQLDVRADKAPRLDMVDLTKSPTTSQASAPGAEDARMKSTRSSSPLSVSDQLLTLAHTVREKERRNKTLSDTLASIHKEHDLVLQQLKRSKDAERVLQDTLSSTQSALTEQKLDLSTNHCNSCGRMLCDADTYLLDNCGAPWCGSCVRERRTECKFHPKLGSQPSRKIWAFECSICHCTESSHLLQHPCGHIMCRKCTRSWASGQHPRPSSLHPDSIVTCPSCRAAQEYSKLLQQPSVEHTIMGRLIPFDEHQGRE